MTTDRGFKPIWHETRAGSWRVEIAGVFYNCVEPPGILPSSGADEAVKWIRKLLTEKRD
jgi:hypothetical protein